MVVAQKLKQDEITEQDSLLLTRNLLRIAIYNISYIRGLFPEKYFNDKSVPALEMKIKKLMPMDTESRRLIDWMEKGVYDALQKKYLKTLLFCICETVDGPMIEEYAFSFSYSSSDSQEVTMNINRTGSKKQGGFKCNSTEVTPAQMKFSACKMVRTLVQLMRTLDKMPEERTILMKLLYYDEVTPEDYEPPFFRGCTAEETQSPWTKNPLKMEVGNVNSKHFVLALKVKSVLDPCEDDSDDNQDDGVSLGADDTMQGDDSSESETEVQNVGSSPENQFIVAPAGIIPEKHQSQDKDADAASEEDTQDGEEDEKQLKRMKDWLISCHLDTVENTDLGANFPDISSVLMKEITEKLVQEGILCKVKGDTYSVKKQKLGCNAHISDYEFDVKEEINDYLFPSGNRTPKSGEDHLYMKALYHALPMAYVSVPKLQTKLDGEANLATVKRLIEKMTKDGFIEPTSNRRLGKRVIRSEQTENKLSEVRKVLKIEAMDVDIHVIQDKQILSEMQEKLGNSNLLDGSTCGGLHSVGSDLTRTREISNITTHQNNYNDQNDPNRGASNSPTSKAAGPVASRESAAPGNDNKGRLTINRTSSPHQGNSNVNDVLVCSRSSQKRKASMVREPILQFVKRQKSQQAL